MWWGMGDWDLGEVGAAPLGWYVVPFIPVGQSLRHLGKTGFRNGGSGCRWRETLKALGAGLMMIGLTGGANGMLGCSVRIGGVIL